ncbi:hypothetical protein [Pseudoalteromonas sp. MMG005]|uniref:hypothetical protein n=1 Tax=Pseudoalteromonas sp. MMG005 TaxID=2822682 RepID=UPI001B3A02DB|nr:hypothetical protein [Pseudoalteromonas sp. MMG005]MBQ4844718.1 hypothetical protein [Pseudoalteromonas sp. MMG005]
MRLFSLMFIALLCSTPAFACEGLPQKALSADEATWSPYLRRGMKHFGLKNDEMAIACFEKIKPYEPGIANIRIATVYHLRFKAQPNSNELRNHALTHYNRALEHPNNIPVNMIRSHITKLLMSLSEQEIIELQSARTGVSRYNYFNAGLYYIIKQQPKQALRLLERAAQEKYWHAKLLLGLLYNPIFKYNAQYSLFKKDSDLAIVWLEKAYNQVPTQMLERQILQLQEYRKDPKPTTPSTEHQVATK